MGEIRLNMKKTDFLMKLDNNQWFLEMLVIKMNEAKLKSIQSSGDANFLIVQTAIPSEVTRATVVIGEDTDLLILLLHHVNQDCHTLKKYHKTLGYQAC